MTPLKEPSPTIQEAVFEYTRWRKHPQSYMNWFVDVHPSDNQTALLVTYRPAWISPAELAVQEHGKFMGFSVIMRPLDELTLPPVLEATEVSLHDRKCPGCGYPCVRCHGKE